MQQQYVQQESGQYESLKKELKHNWKNNELNDKKVNDFVFVFVIFHTYSLIK